MGGGGGVGVLSTVIILLPSLSCRSLYSPCVGSASFNHVDHPRSDLYILRIISAISLPVAIFASAMCCVFCLRGPVLWPVSSYVATLFRHRGIECAGEISECRDERERRGVSRGTVGGRNLTLTVTCTT